MGMCSSLPFLSRALVLGVVVCFMPLVASASSTAVPFLAVDEPEVIGYLSHCPMVPNNEEMLREIPILLTNFSPSVRLRNEVLQDTGTAAAVLRFFDLEKTPAVSDVELDGLQLRSLGPTDVVLLHALTSPVHSHADPASYPIIVNRERRSRTSSLIKIRRTCTTAVCKKGLRGMFDLAKFNSAVPCESAMCAAEKIFGRERAPLLVWTYLKYGVSLTPFVNVASDRYGFSADTIRSIIAAIASTPLRWRTTSFESFSFFRADRNQTYRTITGARAIATNNGAVYNAIDEKTPLQQVGIFIHEIAHQVGGSDFGGPDSSVEWQNASGWRLIARGTQRYYGRDPWFSKYQQTDAFEDFAETYSLFRLNPNRLRSFSPGRFNFMKSQVFSGVDYLTNLCEGTR
ncbi:hypothetical protein BH10BDE1_BH10BDE1_24610 [soil metagenome]